MYTIGPVNYVLSGFGWDGELLQREELSEKNYS